MAKMMAVETRKARVESADDDDGDSVTLADVACCGDNGRGPEVTARIDTGHPPPDELHASVWFCSTCAAPLPLLSSEDDDDDAGGDDNAYDVIATNIDDPNCSPTVFVGLGPSSKDMRLFGGELLPPSM